jgi:hypothetical protein
MLRRFRNVLVWLTLIALPLYGIAGLARACGCPDMQSMVEVATDADLHAAMDSMSMADTSTNPCAGGIACPAGSLHGKCTPSAACSLVAAPALTDLSCTTIETVTAAALPAHAPGFAFVTDAPERPPRT